MRQARKRVSQSAEKERPTQMYASFTMRWKLAVGGRRDESVELGQPHVFARESIWVEHLTDDHTAQPLS